LNYKTNEHRPATASVVTERCTSLKNKKYIKSKRLNLNLPKMNFITQILNSIDAGHAILIVTSIFSLFKNYTANKKIHQLEKQKQKYIQRRTTYMNFIEKLHEIKKTSNSTLLKIQDLNYEYQTKLIPSIFNDSDNLEEEISNSLASFFDKMNQVTKSYSTQILALSNSFDYLYLDSSEQVKAIIEDYKLVIKDISILNELKITPNPENIKEEENISQSEKWQKSEYLSDKLIKVMSREIDKIP
jgi:hypothetical protein